MSEIQSVCVYCGSFPGNDPLYREAGKTVGLAIAEAGLRLVYGGGTKGVMGAVSSAAMGAGAKVTGIIPEFLMAKEATEEALETLDELVVTQDMHERKHLMFERADAFITLPGGIGTVEEIIEIMTWGQLGRHHKPVLFGNIGGFWDPLLDLLEHMRKEGFIHSAHLVQPLVADRAEDIIPMIMGAGGAVEDLEGDRAVIGKM